MARPGSKPYQWGVAAPSVFSNANNRFPGMPEVPVKPDRTNSISPETTGPLPLIDPPCAFTPFTVATLGSVSKSHRIAPSFVEYARRCPSIEPEKTTPGITVTAASCPALHPACPSHAGFGGITFQTSFPVRMSIAASPPAGGRDEPGAIGVIVEMSEFAAYTLVPSVADPHSIPPNPLPAPTRTCQ